MLYELCPARLCTHKWARCMHNDTSSPPKWPLSVLFIFISGLMLSGIKENTVQKASEAPVVIFNSFHSSLWNFHLVWSYTFFPSLHVIPCLLWESERVILGHLFSLSLSLYSWEQRAPTRLFTGSAPAHTQHQHCQALPVLLSNWLKEDFEGGGWADRRGRNVAEGKRHGEFAVCLHWSQSASMCSCLFAEEGSKWDEMGWRVHIHGLLCCLNVLVSDERDTHPILLLNNTLHILSRLGNAGHCIHHWLTSLSCKLSAKVNPQMMCARILK